MAEGRTESPPKKHPARNARKRSAHAEDDETKFPPRPRTPEAEGETRALECAICLQTCVHPARLPCKHIFCFLCLKGITHGSSQCAMCRNPIPPDYLDNPDLLEPPSTSSGVTPQEGYQWFYEGRNGWWLYDPRASTDLETAYNNEESSCELLIAGYLYVIDLREMVQYRKNEPGRKRRIKRDLSSAPRKGIAGLREPTSSPPPPFETEISDAFAELTLADDNYEDVTYCDDDIYYYSSSSEES